MCTCTKVNCFKCYILRFLFDVAGKMYKKYRQKVDSLRKGMLLESNARQREAEEKAIEEIAGPSTSGPDEKGNTSNDLV